MWLEKELIPCPYMALCVTKKDVKKLIKALGLKLKPIDLMPDSSDAVTQIFETHSGNEVKHTIAVILSEQTTAYDNNQVKALLVHEAVHVWQMICEIMNEEKPSAEFEAYSIQHISQQLFYRYDEVLC